MYKCLIFESRDYSRVAFTSSYGKEQVFFAVVVNFLNQQTGCLGYGRQHFGTGPFYNKSCDVFGAQQPIPSITIILHVNILIFNIIYSNIIVSWCAMLFLTILYTFDHACFPLKRQAEGKLVRTILIWTEQSRFQLILSVYIF